MPALLFDTCCCCFSLRTGCLIIGYLELLYEIIMTIFLLLLLTVSGVMASGAIHTDQSSGRSIDLHHQSSHIPLKDSDVQELGIVLTVACVIVLLGLALALAFTITLLVGVHKNKPGHVKAYLIYTTIFLILAMIMFFVTLSSESNAGSICGNLITFALSIYFLLVVRSYYYQMDVRKPAIYNTA